MVVTRHIFLVQYITKMLLRPGLRPGTAGKLSAIRPRSWTWRPLPSREGKEG